MNACEVACELVPLMGFCGTGAQYKYYFNQTTNQCEEYIYVGGLIPFETLAECTACDCVRLVPEGGN